MSDYRYKYKPDIVDLYIVRKGKHKDKIVTADFAYGHTLMFDINGNYVWDYNGGYFDGDNYLRQVGKIIKPKWERYVLKYVFDKIVNKEG